MQYLNFNEKKQHGTSNFPLEFYHADPSFPRYIMNYHWHAEYELIRVLTGQLYMTLDEKEFQACPGDIVFIHSGILHSGTPSSGCVYECLVFDLNAFLKHNPACSSYIQRVIDRSALIYHHFSPKYEDIHQIIWNVFDAMSACPPGYELTTYGELYHFFGVVFSRHLYLADIPQTRKDYKRIMQLKNVLDYMESNYASPVSLQQLADAASMSPKYFCRFFYQMTHRTPMDYLNYQRIEHACYELATSDSSVTEVAYNCGFNDLSYFIKTFKRYKGKTPGKYQA